MAGPTTLFQTGAHGSRPAAGSGCVLYFCTTHPKVYISNASAWADLYDFSTVAPTDAELAAIAALVSAADRIPYFTGSGAAGLLTRDVDGTLAANSDTALATQKAVKTYVDAAVTGLLDFKGSTNASGNPNYPVASKGDSYVVSVAGKVGGASGKAVDVGDVYVASADNAGGTEASVGTSWFVLEHNLAGALLAANNLSDLASAATARTNLGVSAANTPFTPNGSIAATDVQAAIQEVRDEAAGGGSALTVKDEGSNLDTAVTSFDFVGAGVAATAVGHAITVTIAGGGGGSSALAMIYVATIAR